MQDIYNRKNYAMMLIVSVFIKILFTLKKTGDAANLLI